MPEGVQGDTPRPAQGTIIVRTYFSVEENQSELGIVLPAFSKVTMIYSANGYIDIKILAQSLYPYIKMHAPKMFVS